MKNRTFGLVLLAALLLPWSGKAVAQEKTGPEVRFEEAEKLAASGRVGEAITRYDSNSGFQTVAKWVDYDRTL